MQDPGILSYLSGAASSWLPVLLDASVKGLVVLAAAGVVTVVMRWASAAARHMVWLVALIAVFCLPALSGVLPGWRVLPSWLAAEPIILASPASDHTAAQAPAGAVAGEAAGQASSSAGSARAPAEPPAAASVGAAGENRETGLDGPPALTAWEWTLVAWLAGVIVVLGPMAAGAARLRRTTRRAPEIVDPTWQNRVAELSDRLGLRRRVRLFRGDDRAMPMIWGVFRPKMLLPAQAEQWPEAQKRIVLLHELAHARRWDCLTQLIAHLICAAYWFHPLVWYAARCVKVERERACDDLVLRGGSDAADYADQLLQIASSLRVPWLSPGSAIAMARASRLEGRLLAVLDNRRSRRTVSVMAVLACAMIAAGVVLPVAAMRPAPADEAIAETSSGAASKQRTGQEPAPEITYQPPYAVTLPNGVTVELLGVTHFPSKDTDWWRPDGSPLPERPYEQWKDFAAPEYHPTRHLEMAVRLTNVPDEPFERNVKVGPLRGMLGGTPMGSPQTGAMIIPLYAGLKADAQAGTLRYGVAAGPWTILRRTGGSATVGGNTVQGWVSFAAAYEDGDNVVINVGYDIGERVGRVVAYTSDGARKFAATRSGSRSGKGAQQFTYVFANLSLGDVSQFVFESCTMQWVEFGNIAVRPGQETKVQLLCEGEPVRAASMVAVPPTGMIRPNYSYSQVAEHTRVGDGLVGAVYVDLDRSLSVRLPKRFGRYATDEFVEFWSINRGIDLGVWIDGDACRVKGFNASLMRTSDEDWDRRSAEGVQTDADLTDRELGAISTTYALSDLPVTVMFRTLEGRRGLIQIGAASDDPQQITIRYRRVESVRRTVRDAGALESTSSRAGPDTTDTSAVSVPLGSNRPGQAVILAVDRLLRPSSWAGSFLNTELFYIDRREDHSRFVVDDANRRKVFIDYLDLPIDAGRYPILTLRYRARNIKPGEYLLWLDDGTGPNGGGLAVLQAEQVIDDGQVHQLQYDLRQRNPAGPIEGLALGVRCGPTTPAVFDVLALRFDPPGQQALSVAAADKPLGLLVVTPEGDPIVGAAVAVDAERSNFAVSGRTDATGRLSLQPWVNETATHMLSASADGYIHHELDQLTGGADQPLRIVLIPKARYGGRVLDEQGGPVSAATVELRIPSDQWPGRHFQRTVAVRTDEQGRWVSPPMPARLMRLLVHATHPDFARTAAFEPENDAPTIDQLRDQTAVLRLQEGFAVHGRVIDASGVAVANVRISKIVSLGDCRTTRLATTTDAEGRFRFEHMLPGSTALAIEPDGFATDVKVIEVGPDMPALQWSLRPARTIHGQVVAADGQSVKGVHVWAVAYRGQKVLSWYQVVDEDGRFVWNAAPDGPVEFELNDPDPKRFTSIEKLMLEPSEQAHRIKLRPSLRVNGTVVDRRTGRPISRFQLTPGWPSSESESIVWQHNRMKTKAAGEFDLTLIEPAPCYALRIWAEGYEPLDTARILYQPDPVTLQLSLQPVISPAPQHATALTAAMP